MKRFLFVCILFAAFNSFSQNGLERHSFEELPSLQEQEKRPIIVFIYTDWCKYCKRMEKVVFQDEEIRSLLNTSYYFIPLNAEQKEPISYVGNTFMYKPTGLNTGIHELAQALVASSEPLSYPSLVILDEDNNALFKKGEFMAKRPLKKILEYYIFE